MPDAPNRTVEILRETFQPLVERLTPDQEPAVVFDPVSMVEKADEIGT